MLQRFWIKCLYGLQIWKNAKFGLKIVSYLTYVKISWALLDTPFLFVIWHLISQCQLTLILNEFKTSKSSI